jgi:2,5-diamino-6-(ribosylamino)-4(3H)-pyrimidinone 5'-phosphate reductase
MNRPKVVMLNSASVDGRLAVSPEVLLLHGDKRWQAMEAWAPLGVGLSAFDAVKAIHRPQAMLEGCGSFVGMEGEPEPLPSCEGDPETLYRDYLPEAIVHHPEHRGWQTVVDGRGRVRWVYKDGAAFGEAWAGWYLLVLVGRHTPPEYLAYLRREEIPYLVAGGDAAFGRGHVDIGHALIKMRSKLGVERVLSTGGGKLNGALIRAGLVDEVNVEFLPAVVGGLRTASLFDSPDLAPDEWPTRLELISAQVQPGGRVWVRYRVAGEGEEA